MPRHRNGGLRKRCGCPRKNWTKCSHPWHFNFKWRGLHYRLSLEREAGRPITGKTDAQAEAERIRNAIRDGRSKTGRPAPSCLSAGSRTSTSRTT
jgi:hypothetical protein